MIEVERASDGESGGCRNGDETWEGEGKEEDEGEGEAQMTRITVEFAADATVGQLLGRLGDGHDRHVCHRYGILPYGRT